MNIKTISISVTQRERFYIYKKEKKLRNALKYKKQDNPRYVFIYKKQDALRYAIFMKILKLAFLYIKNDTLRYVTFFIYKKQDTSQKVRQFALQV